MKPLRKILATAALIPLAGAALPTAATADPGTAPKLDDHRLVSLDFDGTAGAIEDGETITAGSKASAEKSEGATAEVAGSGASRSSGHRGEALSLSGQGLDLGSVGPNSDLSFATWIQPNEEAEGHQVIASSQAAASAPGFTISTQDEKALVLSITDDEGASGSFAVTLPREKMIPADAWTHIAVTYDASTHLASFYRDGLKVGDTEASAHATELTGIGRSKNATTVGRAEGLKAAPLQASLDDLALFDTAATPDQVRTLVNEQDGDVTDSDAVAADLDAVSLNETLNAGEAPLVTTGPNGSTISWTTSDEKIAAVDSETSTLEVTQPAAGNKDKSVDLTATATVGAATEQRTYSATVPAQPGGTPADSEATDAKAAKATGQSTEATSSGTGTRAATQSDEPGVTGEKLLHNTGIDNVTLEDDYLVNANEKEVDYLLSLDPQKLLYNFYETAGVTQPSGNKPYSDSWETPKGTNFRGHMFGHYLSSLAQEYTYGNTDADHAQIKARLDASLDGLEKAQKGWDQAHPDVPGYISAFPEAFLANVDGQPAPDHKAPGDNLIVPYYNLHKVLAGLVKIAEVVPADQGGDRAKDMAHALGKHLADRLVGKVDKKKMLATEYGGMNEALYDLYALTEDEDIKKAAEMFDETALFDQLAAGKDILNGLHANTTIPKLTGALTRYRIFTQNPDLYAKLSDQEKKELPKYKSAAENFWKIVVKHHTYANGGNSQSEHFHGPDELWHDATQNSPDAGYGNNSTAETCNEYNMLKLTRELFRLDHDVKYADFYEEAYTNQILAAQDPETGTSTYFQPMDAGYFKVFGSADSPEFWCCTGSGAESLSKLGDSIYFTEGSKAGSAVYVNMFYSSTLTLPGGGTLKQESTIPNKDTTEFTVAGTSGATPLKLRVPDWAAGDVTLKVNGTATEAAVQDGYVNVSAKSGDTISYTIPMEVRAEATQDNEDYVAFSYGPILLAAPLESKVAQKTYNAGVLVKMPNYDPDVVKSIVPEGQDAATWKKQVTKNLTRVENAPDGKLQFELKNVSGTASELRFQQWYSLHDSRYGIYFNLVGPDSAAAQKLIMDQKRQARDSKYAFDSIDTFDNNNIEATKNLQTGGTSSTGSYAGRDYRDATNGGWFSYDLEYSTAEGAKNYLTRTYVAEDAGRKFNIYIDDKLFKAETIPSGHDKGTFFEVSDEIPAEFLEDAEGGKITVKFAAAPGPAGGIYGLSINGMDMANPKYSDASALKKLSFDAGELSPAFSGDTTEYELKVPAGTETVNFDADPATETGLVKVVGDDGKEILIDDSQQRAVHLKIGDTLKLNAYAEDWETSTGYTVKFVEADDSGNGADGSDGSDGSEGAADGSDNGSDAADADSSSDSAADGGSGSAGTSDSGGSADPGESAAATSDGGSSAGADGTTGAGSTGPDGADSGDAAPVSAADGSDAGVPAGGDDAAPAVVGGGREHAVGHESTNGSGSHAVLASTGAAVTVLAATGMGLAGVGAWLLMRRRRAASAD